jgi:hypothetical protein
VTFVDPRPPSLELNPRRDRVPVCPYPENPDSMCLLDEESRGPVDPTLAKELGDLMWMRQGRVWRSRGDDPFLRPTQIPPPDDRPLGTQGELISSKQALEVAALYGPASRNNESIRLGENLTNPKVIVLDDDDDGFGAVLDLYRAAVQGSSLSKELELAIGGDVEHIGVGWEDVSCFGVSIERGASDSSLSTEAQESSIHTLEEYKRVVREENARSASDSIAKKEEPPLGIEWSYSCCGYATGRVVDVRSAIGETRTSNKKRSRLP